MKKGISCIHLTFIIRDFQINKLSGFPPVPANGAKILVSGNHTDRTDAANRDSEYCFNNTCHAMPCYLLCNYCTKQVQRHPHKIFTPSHRANLTIRSTCHVYFA